MGFMETIGFGKPKAPDTDQKINSDEEVGKLGGVTKQKAKEMGATVEGGTEFTQEEMQLAEEGANLASETQTLLSGVDQNKLANSPELQKEIFAKRLV